MAHSDNHLRLSRVIGDAVAAATTDGTVVTSAQRNDYLNKANDYVLRSFRDDLGGAVNWLQELVATDTINFAAAGDALPSDYAYQLSLGYNGADDTKDETLKWEDPSRKTALDSRINPNNQDCYTIFGGLIFAYRNNKRLESGTGTFYYLKSDQAASASSTISIDRLWHDVIVDIAALYYFLDKGEIEYQKAEERMRELLKVVIGK